MRYRRVPTWRTWLIILATLGGLAAWLVPKIHGVLALNDPIKDAPYIVVEGWAPDYALMEAKAMAERPEVKLLFTSGIPLDIGTFLVKYDNYAELAATTLAQAGMDPKKILPVPAQKVERDRTAAMAAALKTMLDHLNIPEADRRINVISVGAHSRRSRIIYQRILGSDWKVGVVAVPTQMYREEDWWRQSAGAKTVIDEIAALGVTFMGGE